MRCHGVLLPTVLVVWASTAGCGRVILASSSSSSASPEDDASSQVLREVAIVGGGIESLLQGEEEVGPATETAAAANVAPPPGSLPPVDSFVDVDVDVDAYAGAGQYFKTDVALYRRTDAERPPARRKKGRYRSDTKRRSERRRRTTKRDDDSAAASNIFALRADRDSATAAAAASSGDVSSRHRSFPSAVFSARIVGGYRARRSDWPFVASLHTVYPTRNRNGGRIRRYHDCGGTLLAPDCVLTAAHCTLDIDGYPINGVQVGRYDENVGRLGPDGRNFVIQAAANHPMWERIGRSQDTRYDVRIVKLYGRYDGLVKESLPSINRDASIPAVDGDDDPLFVAGWGVTQPDGIDSSDVLLETAVSYVPNDECAASDGFVNGNFRQYGDRRIGPDVMCTYSRGRDACTGDSGGPVVSRGGGSASTLLVGIVSWGYSCAHPDFPGVHARTSTVSDWIDEALCALSDDPPVESGCGSQSWGNGPAGGPVNVRVELRLDGRPEETGWLLQRIDDGAVYKYVPMGTYRDRPNEVVTEVVTIRRNKPCRFVMLDDAGNGGVRYKLTKSAGGLLASSGTREAFGRSVEHRFTVGMPKQYSVVPWFLGMDYPQPIRVAAAEAGGSALLFKFKPGTATVHRFSSRRAYDKCRFAGSDSSRMAEDSPGRVVVVVPDGLGAGDSMYFGSAGDCARGLKVEVRIVDGGGGTSGENKELVRHEAAWCDRVHNHVGDPLRGVSEGACRSACLDEDRCLGYQYRTSTRRCHILPYRPTPVSAVADTTEKMAEEMRDYVCAASPRDFL